MCIKSPLLKNKGRSKLIKKEVFQKLYFTKMTFFWQTKLLQVRKFYTMNKISNESFLIYFFKKIMCQCILTL